MKLFGFGEGKESVAGDGHIYGIQPEMVFTMVGTDTDGKHDQGVSHPRQVNNDT